MSQLHAGQFAAPRGLASLAMISGGEFVGAGSLEASSDSFAQCPDTVLNLTFPHEVLGLADHSSRADEEGRALV